MNLGLVVGVYKGSDTSEFALDVCQGQFAYLPLEFKDVKSRVINAFDEQHGNVGVGVKVGLKAIEASPSGCEEVFIVGSMVGKCKGLKLPGEDGDHEVNRCSKVH